MKEECFGVIPIIKKDGEWYTFLIQHKNGKHWSFPKGHKEDQETPLQTALRELEEETGLTFVKIFQDTPIVEKYNFIRNNQIISKTVYYFIMEVTGDIKLHPEEILQGEWMIFSKAEKKITYPQSKIICKDVFQIIENIK